MKNILFILLATLNISAGSGPKEKLTASPDLHLISGNIQFVNDDAKVLLTIDFTKAISVEYGSDDKTVNRNEGLMLDSIPVEEWAKDYKEILERTVAYFNEAAEKNGKPIRMTLDPSVAKYEIVFVVDTIDTGNSGAAVFVRHAGCAIGTGDVIVKNRGTSEVLCHMRMDKLKAEWNDIYKVDRIIRLYGWEVMGRHFFNCTQSPVPFTAKFKITSLKDSQDTPNYKFLNPAK